MITRTATAILAAIFLVTISNQANATRVDNFCGDRYCGYSDVTIQGRKFKKIATHKPKVSRPDRVASIGNEPTSESPVAYGLVAKASQYLGQTAAQLGLRRSLWCSAFIRKLTNVSGVDDRAISWLSKPRTSPSIGAIAVMRHHVGIVKGFDNSGNPILISGNHGRRVGIGAYPRSRIIAYVSL